MSAAAAAAVTQACPPWCIEHLNDPQTDPEPTHFGRLTVGEYRFTIVEEEGQPAIEMDDYAWMHLPDVRAYAAALVEAADALDAHA